MHYIYICSINIYNFLTITITIYFGSIIFSMFYGFGSILPISASTFSFIISLLLIVFILSFYKPMPPSPILSAWPFHLFLYTISSPVTAIA
jgi:hypothetical protein